MADNDLKDSQNGNNQTMSSPSSANKPVMVSAARRSGGKFANVRHPGGKFAKMAAMKNQQSNNNNHNENVLQQEGVVSNQKIKMDETSSAAVAKPPQMIERQAQFFQDLDEAERLVFDVLTIASNTAESLAKSTIPSKNQMESLQTNGDEYLQKIKRIHSLLTPHAHLVVPYRNFRNDTTSASGNNNTEPSTKSEETNNAPPMNNSTGSTQTMDSKDDKENSMKKKSNNMYIERVDMILAMEKRNILNELLRLEEKEQKSMQTGNEQKILSDETGCNHNDVLGEKRKRE